MTQRNNILQELNEMNSTLVNISAENIYAVPAGYFEGLAVTMLNRIKAMNAANVVEELNYLSPRLNSFSKQNIYTVPAGYFENLSENVMLSIREGNDYQTAKEEIENLSPLLSGLKKEMPYSVSQGYFDSIIEKPVQETKVISITHRKWFRYAAAAVVIGIIILGGLKFFNSPNSIDPIKNPDRWVKRSVRKIDSKDIDAFVASVDQNNIAPVAIDPSNTDEVKELIKDVSDKEIEDFLNETAAATTESGEDAVMN
jgi:hypothetical protein